MRSLVTRFCAASFCHLVALIWRAYLCRPYFYPGVCVSVIVKSGFGLVSSAASDQTYLCTKYSVRTLYIPCTYFVRTSEHTPLY